MAGLARAAGLLHDIGKASAAYQRYIGGEATAARGPDHATAGAREAVRLYGSTAGRMIALAVAGHHTGLMNGSGASVGGRRSLTERLSDGYAIERYDGWQAYAPDLPARADLVMSRAPRGDAAQRPFTFAFLTRMLFSCLVDADFIATEAFYAAARGETVPRGGVLRADHRERLHASFARRAADDTPVNRLRAEVLAHAMAKAGEAPGLFSLTVPTGGGKTLTSLAFALEHAQRHGLRRVVYVIPFTSIIEQTAQVFRAELGPECADDILEHHSSFDWDEVRPASDDREGEGREGLAKLRRATENWDAPIVVTTAVQFYESLFAARTSRCRKLHNLADSVIILDEAQAIPVPLLRPCMAALDELQRNYGATVVLCTATQPALRKIDGALPRPKMPDAPLEGFDIGPDRELAPDPPRLYRALRRVRVERLPDPVDDSVIVDRFAAREQMLCIVGSRRHARDLFEAISGMGGERHLTTLMCARHRRKALREIRNDLVAGYPVRLVATSVIEAGVDVDFPEVWRAEAGLDAIAQAAGRCNREGRLSTLGRVVVFTPAAHVPPVTVRAFQAAGRAALRWAAARGVDPLGHEAVTEYFRQLYFLKGHDALDAALLDGKPFPIMPALAAASEHNYPFASIAEAFRLIDEAMEPVLIPYGDDATKALAILAEAERPPRDVLRRLQQVSVPVPAKTRLRLIAAGAAEFVRRTDFGDRFVRLTNMELYSDAAGLRLDEPTYRTSEHNVIG